MTMSRLPKIQDHEYVGPLGEGPSGESYVYRTADGVLRVLKCFHPLAINRRLIHGSFQKVLDAGGHGSVAGVHLLRFDSKPPWVVTDFLGTEGEKGAESWTLAARLDGGIDRGVGWRLVSEIAEGLSFLHRIGVPHGNLKPSNVLLADPETLKPVLADYSLGYMDGIYHREAGEDLLYAAPEQLRRPEGINHGEWAGWDVHAFGVLAFRILTGRFPRSHEKRLAWEKSLRAGKAEFDVGMAAALGDESEKLDWGGEPGSWAEEERRRVIERCLHPNPAQRYEDMREVEAVFAHIEEERMLRDERERVAQMRRREQRRLRQARIWAASFGVVAVACAVFAAVAWQRYSLAGERVDELERRIARLVADKQAEIQQREEVARQREAQAMAQAAGAAREMSLYRETLAVSRENADKLFEMVRDRRPASHPGFRGHDEVIADLVEFYEDFVRRIAVDDAEFELERARAYENLGELEVARGNEERALEWFRLAISDWESVVAAPGAPNTARVRLARSRLRQAEIAFGMGMVEEARQGALRAREMVDALISDGPATDELKRLLAAVRLAQGRVARHDGRVDAAFDHYRRATEALSELAERTGRFDYRSDLAHSYVEMGELARGVEHVDRAESVQREALRHLLQLVEERPESDLPRFDLARALGELGEIELSGGDPDKAMELIQESMDLLQGLMEEDATRQEFRYQYARRLSTLGRLRRDTGNREEAVDYVKRAKGIQRQLAEESPNNGYFAYQAALGCWQAAELAADEGRMEDCFRWMEEAKQRLQDLREGDSLDPAQRQQVDLSLAYLIGDLAHLLEESGEEELALEEFRNALAVWQRLSGTYGEDPMMVDAITWARRRISEIEVGLGAAEDR